MTTQVTNLENPQQLELVVSGPDGAARLILCTGIAPIAQEADAGNVKQTWTWRVGPPLGRSQFRGAIVQGALIRFSHSGGNANWSLSEMNAYWDEGSGQVAVRAEVRVIALGTGARARVEGISYQVSILAAAPPAGGTEGEGGALRQAPPAAPAQAQVSMPATSPPPSAGLDKLDPAGSGQRLSEGLAGGAREGVERRRAERRSAESRGAESRGVERRRAERRRRPAQSPQGEPVEGGAVPPPTPGPQPAPMRPEAAPGSGAAPLASPAAGVLPGPPSPTSPGEKLPGPASPTIMDKIPTPPPPAPPPSGSPQMSSAGERGKVGPPPPVLVLTPTALDFGALLVGGFRAKTLTITNSGSAASGPLEMAFGGADAAEFTLTVDPVASANLPPGASGHVLISFQPVSAGPKTATLQISTSSGATVEAIIAGTAN